MKIPQNEKPWIDRAVEAEARVRDLVEQYQAAREHLVETVETAIWMSGSDDFDPNGGKAGAEWVNRRELLYKALTFLSLTESNPASVPQEGE